MSICLIILQFMHLIHGQAKNQLSPIFGIRLYLIMQIVILFNLYFQLPYNTCNMKQSHCFSETFQNTKNQILKQKYEYMLNYLGEVERNTSQLRRENEQLRKTLQQLKTKRSSQQNAEQDLEKEMMRFYEEQKQKIKQIDELKKLISQYKFLCLESMKFQFPNSGESSFSKDTAKSIVVQDSFRSNSFFQADSSQNENSNNISISRNKSYQKIKTKIVCDNCQKQYKPNEYYRHYQDCFGSPLNESSLLSKSRGKEKQNKQVGYKTMRS